MKTKEIWDRVSNIALHLKMAEQGDAEAQCKVGFAYWYGYYGLPEDKTLAFQWYQKAAIRGNAKAQNNLGYMYQYGLGVAEDNALAIKWYQKAAEQGLAIAQCSLGLMYENRIDSYQDKKLAFRWYQKATDQGSIFGLCCLRLHPDIRTQHYSLPLAQYEFGFISEQEWNFIPDEIEDMSYDHLEMADKSDADVQYQLGKMYEKGLGVAKDRNLAIQWYQKAARQGHGMAQYCLGKGDIWYSSDKEGLKWCRMAAVQGYSEAQRNLAVCYGMEFNCLLSFLWHYKAAKQGNAYSLFKAAYLFCGNRTMLSGICDYTDLNYYKPNGYSFKDYYYEFYTKPHMVSYDHIKYMMYACFNDIKENDIEAIEDRVFSFINLIDELIEEKHNVKCPVYRSLLLPNQASSLLQTVSSEKKQRFKSSWQIDAPSEINADTEILYRHEKKSDSMFLEQDIMLNSKSILRMSCDFKKEIDDFLSFPSKKEDVSKWVDLLVSISTHPQALSLSAWQRLEESYYELFFDEAAFDIRWWIAIRNTRIILVTSPVLKGALERWLEHFFSKLPSKIGLSAPDNDCLEGETPAPAFYEKLIKFLRNKLYADIGSLGNKASLQGQCIEWIALLRRCLYPHQTEEALLCQAVAASVYTEPEQKSRKIIKLCHRADEVLDERIRHWQQERAQPLFAHYQDEQANSFRFAIEGASLQGMLLSLANLIHFLLHQQHYNDKSMSVNAQMVLIFHSPWLTQEYESDLDHTQDAIWRQFRLLWLKVANLRQSAQEVILVLKLYSHFLQWLSLQAVHSDQMTQMQRRRYLVRLSGMLQNQFLVKDKTFSLLCINEEEKEAIEARLQTYWPQRLSYCAQLNEGIDSEKQQDIRVLWDRLCLEAKIPLFPLWPYEDLEQILPKLTLALAENRKALSADKKESVAAESIKSYMALKQKGLIDLYAGLEALWHYAIKRMGIVPPCPYALVLLGSGARGDATLYSDMEFLIVIDPGLGETRADDIQSYFSQCFDLFSLQINLLGEKGHDALGKIPYRLGIHLDDKLVPFKDNDGFFGTVPDLVRYFKLEESSAFLEWPHYLPSIRSTDGQSGLEGNQKAVSTIMVACASYDAQFFAGDEKLFVHYLKTRSKILSEKNGLGGYSSRAGLALSFCRAAVLNDFFNTGILVQSIDVKKDFLSVLSGTIKTLSLYHELLTVEGLEIMNTRERCKQLLSRGIITQELALCLETAYLCCDRFRSLTYASYDSAFERWTLFGKQRFIERKNLWTNDIKLWKEAIVLLHDIIYPLHYAVSEWVKIAEQEFKPERVFSLESDVLTRCHKTLANDASNMIHRFSVVVREILLSEKLGKGAFLPRLTPNWWQFFLLAILNLTPVEQKKLWKELVFKLSSVERDIFLETWDGLTQAPKNLQLLHSYLTPKEREILCSKIARELDRIAEGLFSTDGWNLLSYRKQRQWQKSVSALFSDSILNTEDLEIVVIQKGSAVVECVDPAIMPSELTRRRQQDQKTTGLFVLQPFIQTALIEAEKKFFAEARRKPAGKRHVVLFFDAAVEGKVRHFCLKLFPENPGMEYHMTRLQTMLGSLGELPEVSLWRIYTPSYPQGIAALLMEDMRVQQYGVEDRILRLSDKAVIKAEISIDRESFARHFLRVLWSTPEDDKPNDYYVVSLPGGDYKLIRVDNERSLYVSELFEHNLGLIGSASSEKAQPLLKIKTIVYCMEQMNLLLPLSILERVMQLDAKAVFKRWLADISQWNYNAREIFKHTGIMAQSSSSSSSVLWEEEEWSVARLHCERNIYDHGVFHESLNPLCKKESKNFCLVVMPVPIDKFIQSYLFLEKTRQFFMKSKSLNKGLTGLEVLMAIRPEHYKYYHANLAPELRVDAKKSDKTIVSSIVFDRFERITCGGYKRDGESASLYPSMVTSGLGKLMERAGYERILRNESPQQNHLEVDTAEWLIFTLGNYERKQHWDNDVQMMEQILLDRFHKILSVPIANSSNPLGFFSSDVPFYRQFDLILTEFRNLSLINKVQFRQYFLNAQKVPGWNIEKIPFEVKKYLLRLLLNEQAIFSDYPLLSLNTEVFKEFLDEKTLLELLRKYGSTLKKAVIVTMFDPSSIPQFKIHLEACLALKYLELKIVVVAPDLQSKVPRLHRLEYRLPKLRKFILSGFIAVDAVTLDMPDLHHLIVRSCVNLNKGHITVQKLQCLEVYACPKMNNFSFEEMFIKHLAVEQKMPLIKSENTGLKKTFLQNTLHKALRYQSDIVSQIALIAPFRVKQWRALELIFCDDKMYDDTPDYTLSVSKMLDKDATLQDLYSNPDFCSDFARALIAVLKLVSSVHPRLECVNIQVTGESAGIFGAALRLACDETFAVAIIYNGDNLHKPFVAEAQSGVSRMSLRK